MSQSFEISEPARNPRTLLFLFTLIPTLVVLAFVYAVVKPMPPPFVAVMVLAFLFVPNLLIARSIENRRAALDGGTLDIQAGMVNQQVAVADIDLEHARVLRLDEHPEWRPFVRTGGIGLPGLSLGWFRTRNLTRIFCLLTDRQRVLLLPLRGKKDAVLLSLKRPEELLAALRATNDAGSRGR